MSAVTETREAREVSLALEGMTCASCASRIEKSLNAVDGADATVNLATERATVRLDPAVPVDVLVEAVASTGYKAHPLESGAEQSEAEGALTALRRRLVAAVVLTVPLVLLAMIPQLQFGGWEWVTLALATPVVFWCGLPFHRASALNARHFSATMDTLISIGTLAAWGWSAVVLVAGLDADIYFEVAGVITTLILLGRFLEARARRRSSAAIRALLELGAKEARVLRNGEEVLVPLDDVRAGDLFVIRPGEKVATDGIVEEGESAVDQSMLTGESVPVEIGPGSEVIGATINTYGRLIVRATNVGGDTALAQIARLVAKAQAGKAPVQRLADRVSGVFVPVVLGIAVATLAGWLAASRRTHPPRSRRRSPCSSSRVPCALGLATPTALMVGTGRGAQLGILINGPEVLELTRRIGTIVLDKTGTITEGRMELVDVTPLDGADRAAILRDAGAVESASEHPIGKAIADAARGELGGLPAVTAFRNLPGVGVQGVVDGRTVEVARRDGSITVSVERLAAGDARRPRRAQADQPGGGAGAEGAGPHAGPPDGRRRGDRAACRRRGRDRARHGRGSSGGEGGGGAAAAGVRRGRGDGRRRRERRARARPGRPRHRDRNRHRRRDRGLGSHARLW